MTKIQFDTDVLITGAGPTGLTLAAVLLMYGIRCRIIDKNDEPSRHSKALIVHARTLEIFDRLGIAEKAAEAGFKVPKINLHIDNKRIGSAVFSAVESPFPFPLSLEQSETERILEKLVEDCGQHVERKTELIDFQQDKYGVNLTLRKSGRTEETIRSKWLVGCDGAHSTVRDKLNIPFEGSSYEEDFINADTCIDWNLEYGEGHLFLNRYGLLIVFPLRGEKKYRIITLRDSMSDKSPELTEFEQQLHRFGPQDASLHDPSWLVKYRLHRRVAPYMRDKRAFIAGDAAHIHSPAGGQGMNTGIQDAFNLGWKLALVIKNRLKPSVLDSYNEERLPVIKEIVEMTDRAFRIGLGRNSFINSMRKFVAPIIVNQPWVIKNVVKRVSQTQINYRKSSFVEEEFYGTQGPKAGDRAPDCTIYLPSEEIETINLFEITSCLTYTLLLLGGMKSTPEGQWELENIGKSILSEYGDIISVYMIAAEVPSVIPDWQGKLLIDPEKELHKKYGAFFPCLYLIRPDGHIAYRSLPPDKEKFLKYLEKYRNFIN